MPITPAECSIHLDLQKPYFFFFLSENIAIKTSSFFFKSNESEKQKHKTTICQVPVTPAECSIHLDLHRPHSICFFFLLVNITIKKK